LKNAPLACVGLLAASCSLALNWNQCQTDDQCAHFTDGGTAYCTTDHICVSDVPSDRLCELSTSSKDTPDAVTIAGLFRRTGANEVKDTDMEHAAELAVTEINQQGARPLRLVLCDTAGDPMQAQKALAVAVESFGAVGGVGPTSSAEVVALASSPDFLVKKYDYLLISPSATAPTITTLDDAGLVWRTAASDNLQAQVLAELVPSMTTSAATAYVDSTYGTGLKDAFATALGTYFATTPLIPAASAFMEGTPGSTVVTFLQGHTPEVALIVADSDAPTWIAALNQGGSTLSMTQYLLTDGSKSPTLFSLSPTTDVAMRIKGTAPATPSGPAFNAFQGTYKGNYGKDPSNTAFVANAYDATYALALAMGGVPIGAKITGHALIVPMQSLSDPNGLPVRVGPGEFGMGYQRLADGGNINLDGTSGPIDFDPDTGDVVSAPIEEWAIDTTPATGGVCGLDASGAPICPFKTVQVCGFVQPDDPCAPP
jgi:ABC-type branched-subunit amino acid transport system substrate-binding protein